VVVVAALLQLVVGRWPMGRWFVSRERVRSAAGENGV